MPGASDDVCITFDGTYTVTLGGSVNIASLTLGASPATGVQTLVVQGTATEPAQLSAISWVTNSGMLVLDSVGDSSAATLSVLGGTFENMPGGTLVIKSFLSSPRVHSNASLYDAQPHYAREELDAREAASCARI